MSLRFGMSTKFCLEWYVQTPSRDIQRKSPKFLYRGIEWYLCLKMEKITLESFKTKLSYTLTLCTEDSLEEFDKQATLLVFVRSKQLRSVYGGKSAITEHFLWYGFVIDIRDSFNSEWKVYCIFSSDLPSELHIKEGETKHVISSLTVQSDLLESSNIMRRAKFAAIASDDSFSDEDNLSTDFGKLLEQQSTSDVTVTCGGRTFSAHRIILAARSKVFAAMFDNKMIESETGSIDIKDIDGEIFELLLKYVYTGKIPELSADIASSLYIAADKYSILSLKNKCSKWMLGNVTKENCLEFLFVADTFHDAILKDRLVNFVAEILLLLEEDEWQKFSDKYPKLANSVYKKRVFTKKV